MPLFEVTLPLTIEADDAEGAVDTFVTSLVRNDIFAYTFVVKDTNTGEVVYHIDGTTIAQQDAMEYILSRAQGQEPEEE